MDKHTALATSFPAPTSSVPLPPTWRDALPVLSGPRATLRELRKTDARGLLPLIAAPEVAKFISAPPRSIEQLAAFIEWGQRERMGGRYAGFALVPRGRTSPVGLVQLRQLDPSFHAAEWGFAMGSEFWGSGLFPDAARLLLEFAFDVLLVQRMEARAAVPNARAHTALRRLGAVQEGVLRQSLVNAAGERFDQVLWSMLADDWREATSVPAVRIH